MKAILELLKKEVVPAQGCTEPVAVSFASAIAAKVMEEEVQELHLTLSTNIIKNALGVGIPGTGSIGIEIAAALGVIIKEPEKKLEVLCNMSEDQLACAKQFLKEKTIKVHHADVLEKLYIQIDAISEHHKACVIICREHCNVVLVKKDQTILYEKEIEKEVCSEEKRTILTFQDILSFIKEVPLEDLMFLKDAIDMNKRVSREGLTNTYGLQVGSKILNSRETDILSNSNANRIIAATAAASDARMDGCSMPIMTCAGSGNQGIACTMPVITMADLLLKNEEDELRALALSCLCVIYMKQYMGRLSPLCGAGMAGATGACLGMTYLLGGREKELTYAIKNMIADVSGMLCDGAKTTCALKIATSTNAAIQCATLAMNKIAPTEKEGIIFEEVDTMVEHIETLVKDGLSKTDDTILKIMLDK